MITIKKVKYYLKQYDNLYNQYLIYKSLRRDIVKHAYVLNYKYLVNNVKNSETLFVLGSGKSINQMTEINLKLIQENDSVGFNNWILHKFVPDYYLIDFKNNTKEEKEINEAQINNINFRYLDYKNVHFILRLNRVFENHIQQLSNLKNLYFAFQLAISGATSFDYRNNIKFLISTRLINKNHILYNKNSTVHNSIIFGYKMGYKKIVLCGIDLSNVDYFFDSNKEDIKSRGLIIPPSVQAGQLHKTNDPANCAGGLPISKIITVLNEVLLKPNNIKLYIATKNSALYPQLPLYKW